MNKKTIVIIVIVVVIIGVWMFWSSRGASAPTPASDTTPIANTGTPTTSTSTNTTATLMTSTGQQFSSSQYYKNAYEVYPALDPTNGSRALSGFNLQTQDLGGGVTQVTLVAKQANYHTQTFVIGPGQKLYFIERSFGDDSTDQDVNYGDDMGIAVDAQGNILQ